LALEVLRLRAELAAASSARPPRRLPRRPLVRRGRIRSSPRRASPGTSARRPSGRPAGLLPPADGPPPRRYTARVRPPRPRPRPPPGPARPAETDGVRRHAVRGGVAMTIRVQAVVVCDHAYTPACHGRLEVPKAELAWGLAAVRRALVA